MQLDKKTIPVVLAVLFLTVATFFNRQAFDSVKVETKSSFNVEGKAIVNKNPTPLITAALEAKSSTSGSSNLSSQGVANEKKSPIQKGSDEIVSDDSKNTAENTSMKLSENQTIVPYSNVQIKMKKVDLDIVGSSNSSTAAETTTKISTTTPSTLTNSSSTINHSLNETSNHNISKVQRADLPEEINISLNHNNSTLATTKKIDEMDSSNMTIQESIKQQSQEITVMSNHSSTTIITATSASNDTSITPIQIETETNALNLTTAPITFQKEEEEEEDKAVTPIAVVETGNPKRNRRKKKEKKEIIFSHFISHIPKSGASYAFDMVNRMLWFSPEHEALDRKEKFRGCNEAKKKPVKYQDYRYHFKGIRCTLWMSEQPYSRWPQHIYTIVRDPRAHTLSMYFHCKESKDHAKQAHRMPSLDDWLDAWVDAIGNETRIEQNRAFRCYNPIDAQSKYVDFDASKGKEDLKERYDVIGDNAQMAKTVCVIFIKYAGWVPKECNCSEGDNTDLSMTSSLTTLDKFNSTMNMANTTTTTTGRRRLSNGSIHHLRRRLEAEEAAASVVVPSVTADYNLTFHSHGVQHHGATFQTTPRQDAQIAKLRQQDGLLYPIVKEAFQDQLAEVEEKYQVQICSKLRITTD